MDRVRLLLLLVVLGSAAALGASPGCMTDPVTGKSRLGLINPSDDEEVRQGRQYAPSFTAEYDGAYPDAAAAEYLSAIVRRIGAASHRPTLPYRFTLLNSSVPNAFALPGGEVFMTRGLLARLDEEAMFAVVMGHEVGHVCHRHSVRAMNDQLLVGLGGALLAGSLEDERDREIVAGLAGAGGGLLLLRFSRDQELESDERGAEYAHATGYDPRRGTRVFEEFARMKAEAGAGGGLLESWTSSHPLDADRVRHLRGVVDERYPSLRGDAPAPGLVVSTPSWDRLQASLRAAHAKYEELDRARADGARALAAGDGAAAQRALAAAERAGETLPGHALFPAVEGAILHGLGDRRRGRERFERAVRLQPDLYFARTGLARLEAADGRHGPAAEHAAAAAGLVPEAPEPRMLLGQALAAQGRNADAAAAYRAAADLAPAGSKLRARALARVEELQPTPKGPARRR